MTFTYTYRQSGTTGQDEVHLVIGGKVSPLELGFHPYEDGDWTSVEDFRLMLDQMGDVEPLKFRCRGQSVVVVGVEDQGEPALIVEAVASQSNPRPAKDKCWLTCKHVVQGTATEVWCRPDGIALCAECAKKGPDNFDLDDGTVLCPACMETALKSVPVVDGREFVERAAMSGHCH